MHNVLLLYREFPDAFWSFKHSREFINKKASSPPLGILTVEAMLPCSGLKSLLICNVSRLPDEDLARADYFFGRHLKTWGRFQSLFFNFS